MSKPKRNDDCYCGSGLKYKKCHMPIDQEAEREARALKEAVVYIGRNVIKFARDERFAEGFALALPLYWNELYTLEQADEMSHEEALRFIDWFLWDYELPPTDLGDGEPVAGLRLIEVYHKERRADLSAAQQQVIDDWVSARPASGFELLGYEGQLLQLRDYFTGEEFEVFEATGRGAVEIGEVILTRLVRVGDHWEFSTNAAYLPAAEITDIKEKMAAAKTADFLTHPDATHDEFMRRHNHLIIHHALAEAEKQGRPPVARLNPNRPDKVAQKVVRRITRKGRK